MEVEETSGTVQEVHNGSEMKLFIWFCVSPTCLGVLSKLTEDLPLYLSKFGTKLWEIHLHILVVWLDFRVTVLFYPCSKWKPEKQGTASTRKMENRGISMCLNNN